MEQQLNEVQALSMRNRECIVKNETHICEVGRRSSVADKPSYSAVVSNSPVSKRVKKAVAVGGGTAVNGNTGAKKTIGGGTAVNVIGNTGLKNAVGGGTAVYGNPGLKNAVGGGSGIADNKQNDNTGVKNVIAVDRANNVQNVYKGWPLGRCDIVSVNTTDTDNGFLYQPRKVRRLRKQQSHSYCQFNRDHLRRFIILVKV